MDLYKTKKAAKICVKQSFKIVEVLNDGTTTAISNLSNLNLNGKLQVNICHVHRVSP